MKQNIILPFLYVPNGVGQHYLNFDRDANLVTTHNPDAHLPTNEALPNMPYDAVSIITYYALNTNSNLSAYFA